MKVNHYFISLLIISSSLNFTFSQETNAKLSGESIAKLSGESIGQGFSIKDSLNNTLLQVTREGFVGIGTINPLMRLQVNGSVGWGSTNAILNTDQGASIELRGSGSPYIDFSNNSISDYNIRLVLNQNNILEIDGDVGIGTASTSGYKLAVGGNIIAEEIVVKLKENWPDYIFNKNYERLDLKGIEKYIQDNGHLPNIPNAKDVSDNGINIGEIQAKLLEKIEELTIYLIEQDKKLTQLRDDYESLKKKIDSN